MLFLNLLLQINSTLADTTAAAAEAEGRSVSMLELVVNGGVLMIPIAVLSIIAIYLIVERYLTLKRADRSPDDFLDDLKSRVVRGDLNGARDLCKRTNTPFSRMLEKGVSKLGAPLSKIEASIENVGRMEIYKLERFLNHLATIAGAAPMIGFLGTVIGMVQAFISIAQAEGAVSPKLLSSGIYQAMVTTIAGLMVGIIAYIGYNWLVGKVEKIVHQMEHASIEFIELLQEPAKHEV